MQRTASFHDPITDAGLSETAGVVDDATALDATVDMLDAHAPPGDAPIRRLLCTRERTASRLPGRHDDLNLVECERLEAQILEQAAPRGQGVGRRLGNPLIMGAASIGLTEKEDRQRRVDQQHIFHRVAFLLAAITARLLSRILGAPDAPFGAIMPKRGEVVAGAGRAAGAGGCSRGTTIAVASASATPRRFASSLKDRAGDSPSVRSVACRTTNST
jgi:hypothetical protein